MGNETSVLRCWTVSVSDGMAQFRVSVTFRDGFQALQGGFFIAVLCEFGHFSFAYDMKLPDLPYKKQVNI